jgi:alkylhydroperoxidase family enzyme
MTRDERVAHGGQQWPFTSQPAEPRLPMVEIAAMPPDVLATVDDIESKIGLCPNIIRTLALAAGCVSSLHDLINDINTRQALSMRRREILILYVSKTIGGRYEWIQHEPLARREGLGDDEILALRNLNTRADCFLVEEKAMLRYAEEVMKVGKATPHAFATLRAHFSPQEILEITLDLGIYRMLSEITENAETPLDPPFASPLLDGVLEERRRAQ